LVFLGENLSRTPEGPANRPTDEAENTQVEPHQQYAPAHNCPDKTAHPGSEKACAHPTGKYPKSGKKKDREKTSQRPAQETGHHTAADTTCDYACHESGDHGPNQWNTPYDSHEYSTHENTYKEHGSS
jgi:hypothetical protein